MHELFTLGELAELLKVPAYRILYLLTSRQVAEPRRIAGRRVFTAEEAAIISEKLKIQDGLSNSGGGADD